MFEDFIVITESGFHWFFELVHKRSELFFDYKNNMVKSTPEIEENTKLRYLANYD